MDHVVQLVNVKLLYQRLSFLNLYFQTTILKVILIFVNQLLFLIEIVSSLWIDVKFQWVSHPVDPFIFIFDIF